MDYVDDATLRTVLADSEQKRVSIEFALTVMNELALALRDLHKLGFVHRDLKPENIFVSLSKKIPQVRLVDFGLTKEDAEGTQTRLRTGGSIGYISPEQLKGLPTKQATDVYAFGAIAFELITGELPGVGDAIDDYVQDIPEHIDELIMQCLVKNPDKRPANGERLVELLTKPPRPVGPDNSPTKVSDGFSSPALDKGNVGRLILSGVPDASTIYINGREVYGAVHNVDLNSESQQVDLLIKSSGFEDFSRKVLLVASSITDESITMQKIVTVRQPTLSQFPHLQKFLAEMRVIPSGSFVMGRPTSVGDTMPVRTVTLSSFRIGAIPVTWGVWSEYCKAIGRQLEQPPTWGLHDDHPVVKVSWYDIVGQSGSGGFCAWASNIAEMKLTLPTEAQFEYACRGGASGTEYPWGNVFDRRKVWCSTINYPGDAETTVSVNRKTNVFRNPYGLIDLTGNIAQWCFDWYGPYYRTASRNPVGPSSSTERMRVVRGGSWFNDHPDYFRCAYRGRYSPDVRLYTLGFRLVENMS
jgi:formylglycine-generating enzyme required for sulfatase activity